MYRGFSTIGRSKRFVLLDFDTVKQDIINHFSIKRGEKLMNPNFGSAIWDLLFDPYDEKTQTLILDDIRRIISYDPRVTVGNMVINQYENGIQVDMEISLVQSNQKDLLSIKFDKESKELFLS